MKAIVHLYLKASRESHIFGSIWKQRTKLRVLTARVLYFQCALDLNSENKPYFGR